MAVQDVTGFEGGSINKQWNPAMVPSPMSGNLASPSLFMEVDAALQRIAETAAQAGNAEGADWPEVYRAMGEALRLIDEL